MTIALSICPRRHAAARSALAAAVLFALSLAPCTAMAEAPLVRVSNAWVRGTVEGQTGSGAYMELTAREDAQLIGATCTLAEHVEVHEMHVVNDMMRMRRVQSLALPRNTTVALNHDFHIMLIGLKRQLTPGQNLTITLQITDAAGVRHDVPVRAPVRALNTAANHGSGHE